MLSEMQVVRYHGDSGRMVMIPLALAFNAARLPTLIQWMQDALKLTRAAPLATSAAATQLLRWASVAAAGAGCALWVYSTFGFILGEWLPLVATASRSRHDDKRR